MYTYMWFVYISVCYAMLWYVRTHYKLCIIRFFLSPLHWFEVHFMALNTESVSHLFVWLILSMLRVSNEHTTHNKLSIAQAYLANILYTMFIRPLYVPFNACIIHHHDACSISNDGLFFFNTIQCFIK